MSAHYCPSNPCPICAAPLLKSRDATIQGLEFRIARLTAERDAAQRRVEEFRLAIDRFTADWPEKGLEDLGVDLYEILDRYFPAPKPG